MPCSKLLSHHVKNPNIGIQSIVNVRRGLFSTCKGKLRLGLLKKAKHFKLPGLEEELVMKDEKQDFCLALSKLIRRFATPGFFFLFEKKLRGFGS